MSTLIKLNLIAPHDATHYLLESKTDYECWLKKGYSMRVGSQTEWVKDHIAELDIADGRAFEIVK